MANIDTPKKPAVKGWHKAEIKAELEKAGWSLRQLSMAHGYSPNSLKLVLSRPWPRAEGIVARAISAGEADEVQPWDIWPSRYNDEKPNRPMGRTSKSIAEAQGFNVHYQVAI